jgi:hypothetical protein
MGFKKRRLMLVPEVNLNSFVLFFEKGDSGLAWSIHDYSEKGPFKLIRRKDFEWTADQVREKATYSFDAPTVATDEFDYWHERTWEYNRKYLAGSDEPASKPGPKIAKPPKLDARGIIEEFINHHSDDIFTKRDLAQRASAHKRKIDGAGVSAASITRICKGEVVGRSIREAVAKVISSRTPCTGEDLLPPEKRTLKRSETK